MVVPKEQKQNNFKKILICYVWCEVTSCELERPKAGETPL
ncbi:rCG20007 [Rattus norvegicus]|uniref:RCG20007 n=1 Tax=Rattus norvegicus TaxID=10116 RepID=A6KIE1_RAT|nr:rCG20007 [Rattus norvegicus]